MITEVYSLVALIGVAVGATWVLRSKLGDVESALGTHVARDDERHADHEARIFKLEGRRKR
jgi:hypothetical protein